jgi:hypothetical protein
VKKLIALFLTLVLMCACTAPTEPVPTEASESTEATEATEETQETLHKKKNGGLRSFLSA